MKAEEIPQEWIDILDHYAGKAHSRDGYVAQALAEILTLAIPQEGNGWDRQRYQPFVGALDRCQHGRHSRDRCFDCPDGRSTGNLLLEPGQRIGTTLYGQPITVPAAQGDRGDQRCWVPEGDVK